MAGNSLQGLLCATTSPAIDRGTTPLARIPVNAPTCVFHGTPSRKSSSGKSGGKSPHTILIHKARSDASAMLTARLADLDAWSLEAVVRAADLAKGAELSAPCEATRQLFLGWFGTDDAAARATIRARIVKAIAKLNVLHDSDFLPDPASTDYAYVYDGATERGKYERTVHIGSAFWTADDKTRAGTLIHELSHFHTVGHTDDVGSDRKQRSVADFPGINLDKYSGTYAAYGGARAARLAIKNPAMALKNADSFEFFIEGRVASVIQDEKGALDTEGFGDFPSRAGNVL